MFRGAGEPRPLGGTLNIGAPMKVRKIAILILFAPRLGVAQDSAWQPTWELAGTLSFQSSSASGRLNGATTDFYLKEQVLTIQPTAGYFVTDNIEVLLAPQYSFSLTDDDFGGGPDRVLAHQIGGVIGFSFNYRINPFFVPFVGLKAGASWSRVMFDPDYDSGWARRRIIFPDLIVGGRFFISNRWALVLATEYVKHTSQSRLDTSDLFSVGLGFSVFL
jgi:hypothetical protein